MDLDSFLVSLYVLVDDWWQVGHGRAPSRPGRPALLTDPEVITLAILAQWPRFRSERDFWRFAWAHLREYFPKLCSQGQFNRRVRALEPELRALQRSLADELSDPSGRLPRDGHDPRPGHRAGEGFPQGALLRAGHLRQERLQDLVVGLGLQGGPGGRSWGSHHRLRAGRGLFRGEAHSRDALVAGDRHEAYLADKGFTGVEWERRWLEKYGALVAATPYDNSRRAWPKADRRWAAGKRQIIEGVVCQLKDFFSVERHRAKTLGGLLARLTAKVAAYTCAQRVNASLGRPLRHLADLLI